MTVKSIISDIRYQISYIYAKLHVQNSFFCRIVHFAVTISIRVFVFLVQFYVYEIDHKVLPSTSSHYFDRIHLKTFSDR